MQIQLVKNCEGLAEWVLLELQGRIELGPGRQSLDGQHFGNLEWKDGDKGMAKLVIGHQLLEGRLSELEKPLLVLDRASLGEKNAEMARDTEPKSCEMIAIVRRKLVFTERPKPIIAQHPCTK